MLREFEDKENILAEMDEQVREGRKGVGGGCGYVTSDVDPALWNLQIDLKNLKK